MKKIFIAFFSIVATLSQAQTISIIPQPAEIKQPKIAANFSITPATQILLEGSGLEKSVQFLNNYLDRFYHFKLKTVKKATSKNVIALNFERMDGTIPGAYALTVGNKGVYIAGD